MNSGSQKVRKPPRKFALNLAASEMFARKVTYANSQYNPESKVPVRLDMNKLFESKPDWDKLYQHLSKGQHLAVD